MESLPPITSRVSAADLERLKAAARTAADHAHAPYSHFPVGAAVLDEEGRIFAGCNVENASFGLTMCAERVAVGHAIAAGAKGLRAIAIYTPTEALTPPCGACRQVLLEFNPAMEVHVFNASGRHAAVGMDQLLPASFRLP